MKSRTEALLENLKDYGPSTRIQELAELCEKLDCELQEERAINESLREVIKALKYELRDKRINQ